MHPRYLSNSKKFKTTWLKFSTKVKLNVKSKQGKGSIEIPFTSEDDLSRILELLDW